MKIKLLIFSFLLLGVSVNWAQGSGRTTGGSALAALKIKKPPKKASAATSRHTNKPKGLGNHFRPVSIENTEVEKAYDAWETNPAYAVEQFAAYSNSDADAAYGLGLAYYEQDRLEEAVNAFENAILLDNYFQDAYYWLGVIYEELGDYETSADALYVAIELDEEDSDAWWQLGYLYYASGYSEEAQLCLDEANYYDPDFYSTNLKEEYSWY